MVADDTAHDVCTYKSPNIHNCDSHKWQKKNIWYRAIRPGEYNSIQNRTVQYSKVQYSTILIVCVALSESDAASALLRLVVSTWFTIGSIGVNVHLSMNIIILV